MAREAKTSCLEVWINKAFSHNFWIKIMSLLIHGIRSLFGWIRIKNVLAIDPSIENISLHNSRNKHVNPRTNAELTNFFIVAASKPRCAKYCVVTYSCPVSVSNIRFIRLAHTSSMAYVLGNAQTTFHSRCQVIPLLPLLQSAIITSNAEVTSSQHPV